MTPCWLARLQTVTANACPEVKSVHDTLGGFERCCRVYSAKKTARAKERKKLKESVEAEPPQTAQEKLNQVKSALAQALALISQ